MVNFEQWLAESVNPLTNAVISNTKDHLPILVAADWLQDHGDDELGNTIRWLVVNSVPQPGVSQQSIQSEAPKYKQKLNEIMASLKPWKLEGNRVYNTDDNRQYTISGNKIISRSSGEMPEEVAKLFLIWRAILAFDSGFTKDGHMANISVAEANTLLDRIINQYQSALEFVTNTYDNIDLYSDDDDQVEKIRNMIPELNHVFSLVGKRHQFYHLRGAELLSDAARVFTRRGERDLALQLQKFAKRMV